MNEEKTIAQYLEPNYTGVPWEAMPGDFARGKGAMLLDGSWDLASIQQANAKVQVGFFPLPFSNTAADNQAYVQDDLTFSVLNASPNKAAADEVAGVLLQPLDLLAVREHHRHLAQPEERDVQRLRGQGHGDAGSARASTRT